jgi:hypothetical protein
MNTFYRYVFVLGATVAGGCIAEEPAQMDPGEASPPPSVAAEPPAQPMPPLPERAERMLAELGPEAATLRTTLRMEGERMALSRREAMVAVGPRVRAAMRRHHIRVEELARHLSGGA